MAKQPEEFNDALIEFIRRQHVYFVATAPNAASGHVNCSPKGLDSLEVLGPTTLVYRDFVGSGAETIAHLRENARIVVMFCAFEGPPKIVRVHGRGTVVEPGDPGFAELLQRFGAKPGTRAFIRVDAERIAISCGYGVPLMTYQGDRTQLTAWAERKGNDALVAYQRENNLTSIDGLPALRMP
ncbi:MAG: pyridoxamine 5'-phosphate oxidase family protein [Phycisphaerales bacterium]|nr:pyridoxamine 5'-phosphate oxidase family protein [Phycisphaerales bacterium]